MREPSLVKSKASCFIDACEVAFDCGAQTLARDYRDICGDTDHEPDVEGYHSSIVNQCFLERYGRGLTQVDMLPVVDDEPIGDDPSMYVSGWFKRPHFQAVLTGERPNGEFHAIAYRNGTFFDSDGTVLATPNIGLKYVWVLGVPPMEVDGETE